MCVVFGCACALVALVPLADADETLGERVGTASAVLAVTFASYFVVRRRIRMQRAYVEVRQIAEVTQRVLLRPVPERIGPVATAVEYLSAAIGAHVGGDFYEVIDTPYGVRAILGDMRGNGLDAVSGAAAVLGAFREAGAVEPTLEAVAVRLDAALVRHAAVTGHAELIVGQQAESHDGGETSQARADVDVRVRPQDEAQVWTEDFATAVLVQVPHSGAWHGTPVMCTSEIDVTGHAAAPVTETRDSVGLELWHGVGANEVKLVNCGHPSPYLIRGGQTVELEPERLTLPLGLGSLADEPYAVSSSAVPFEPGDALVFYTDGVSDARARSGEFFPLDALLRDLDGTPAITPRSVAAAVRSRLLEHMRGELDDDAALLILGRLGGDSR